MRGRDFPRLSYVKARHFPRNCKGFAASPGIPCKPQTHGSRCRWHLDPIYVTLWGSHALPWAPAVHSSGFGIFSLPVTC